MVGAWLIKIVAEFGTFDLTFNVYHNWNGENDKLNEQQKTQNWKIYYSFFSTQKKTLQNSPDL